MQFKNLVHKVAFAGVALALAQSAMAGLIISPESAIATSTNYISYAADGDSQYDIKYAINQAGLYDKFISGVTDFDTYMASNPIHDYLAAENEWFGAKKGIAISGAHVIYPKDTLIFDLGMNYEIDRFALWNEENGGIRLASISGSSDGINFDPLLTIKPVGNPFQPLTSGNPVNHAYDYGAQIFSFDSIVNAQYLKFDLTCPNNNSIYAGCSLGEIAFSVADNVTSSASVPEPSVIMLFSAGLVGLGISRKRKISKVEVC